MGRPRHIARPPRHIVLLTLLALAVLGGTLTAIALRPDAPAPRAMWLWQRTAAPAKVVTWATDQNVNEIYAHISTTPAPTELARLRELKQRCDNAGIRLSALGGEPDWAFDHTTALHWQRTALSTGLFAATHIDVEPYALPAWNTDRPRTVAAFTSLLAAMANADQRPLQVDVPFWYGTIPANNTTLADAVLTHADAVTVMSYRDTATGPDSLLAVGTDMLTRADRAGRPVHLGAETTPLPTCSACTFHEQGAHTMATTLSEVDAAAADHPSYAGIAVHDYNSWTTLHP
ncbi:hypothetical protein [Actinomadura hibisca]|uniref:hypothetical protein n=1 Tax=Actinomadura hibisca TaxID=68565 RepID=UPI0008303D63|nr:hypothetical protein [Actinomadura hibisca]